MKIEVRSAVPASGDEVRLVWQGKDLPPGIPAAEFEGKKFSTLLLRNGAQRRLFVGLGQPPAEGETEHLYRIAAGVGVKALIKIGADEISIAGAGVGAQAQAVVEGAAMAFYRFDQFRPENAQRKTIFKKLTLVTDDASAAKAKEGARRGEILAAATNEVRAIGNLPANVVTPLVLAQKAKEIAAQYKLSCQVFEVPKLKRDGFGGILAVGQGSANPPCLITMEYWGGGKKSTPIAIVGKGITFDTGGVSIKPADRMDEMKFDKMGACAVLGIMAAVAALKLPISVVGIMAAAENMNSDRAYRPGDIVTTYDGKTIEVLNTDAEGRVVLADALAYARQTYKPSAIVDLATLTGACIVGLGAKRAGLFANDEALAAAFITAAAATGEPVWRLPLHDDFQEQIKSDVALVKNTGGREGGACTAAAFLQNWVEELPWVHLDIAGPAWITKDYPGLEKGATGFGVRLVTHVIEALAKKK